MATKFVMPARFSRNKVQGELFGEGKIVGKYFALMDGGGLLINHRDVNIKDLPEDKPILVIYDKEKVDDNGTHTFQLPTKPTAIVAASLDAEAILILNSILDRIPRKDQAQSITWTQYKKAFRAVTVRIFKSTELRTMYLECLADNMPANYFELSVQDFEEIITFNHIFPNEAREDQDTGYKAEITHE